MGRMVAGLAVVVALVAGTAPAARGAAKPPSPADVAAAQKRANAAAAQLSKARSALAIAEQEVAALEARTAATSEVVSSLEGEVRELAVRQYVEGGRQATWVGGGDPGQAARGQAMLRFVTVGRTDAVEGYRVARLDLEEGRAALDRRLAERRAAVAGLRRDEAR
ncbi:MAG: hypothetical protein M3Q48_17975, partial [Actinomycetota bacterium]|nr:hypothetical protein [Actinomycetota bacterium]